MHILHDSHIKSSLCTQGIHGEIYIPEVKEEVGQIIEILRSNGLDYYIKGGASNTLFCGNNKGRLTTNIIDMSQMKYFSLDEDTGELNIDSGACLVKLSRCTSKKGFSGLEFACGIPGQVGGAIATSAEQPRSLYQEQLYDAGLPQNIPDRISDILEEVTVINAKGDMEILNVDQLEMKDRSSIFKTKNILILSAKMILKQGDKKTISTYSDIVMQSRLDLRARNSECNPYTDKILGFAFVGCHSSYGENTLKTLIQQSSIPDCIECKGMVHYRKTPGIICNKGKGDPNGYLEIIDIIREVVLKDTGVELIVEVDIVH